MRIYAISYFKVGIMNEGYTCILNTIKNYKINEVHKKTSIILCSNEEHKKMMTLLDILENTK